MSLGGGGPHDTFIFGSFLDWWSKVTANRDAKRTAKAEAKAARQAKSDQRIDMADAPDPRVGAYIDGLPDWQAQLCRELRTLIHAADDEVVETIKRTDRPYFTLQGNICALLATKDHVNLFLYDGGIVPDPARIITSGHDNSTARTVAFWEGDSVNTDALLVMLRQIIANNRAGGWRKLKRSGPSPRS